MAPSLIVEPLKPGTSGGVLPEWAPPANADWLVAPTASATATNAPRNRPSFFPRIVVTPFVAGQYENGHVLKYA